MSIMLPTAAMTTGGDYSPFNTAICGGDTNAIATNAHLDIHTHSHAIAFSNRSDSSSPLRALPLPFRTSNGYC
jgi:hypothetical protein